MRNKLIAKLHILIKEKGLEEFKQDMYAGYGVTSCREMSNDQISELIHRLENKRVMFGGGRQSGKTRSQLQSQVLATLNRLGIREDTTKVNAAERWAELNQFVRSKNPAGKTLPEMSNDELQQLFVILKSMESKGWRKKESKPQETPVVIPIPIAHSGIVN